MAPGLHGSARTTPRVRAELQASQEATGALAARYGLNPKAVAKWRKRATTSDLPMGPRRPRSAALTELEKAVVVEFRRRTLLPLDDVLGCLRESIPALSRSALHRCLKHARTDCPNDWSGALRAALAYEKYILEGTVDNVVKAENVRVVPGTVKAEPGKLDMRTFRDVGPQLKPGPNGGASA